MDFKIVNSFSGKYHPGNTFILIDKTLNISIPFSVFHQMSTLIIQEVPQVEEPLISRIKADMGLS